MRRLLSSLTAALVLLSLAPAISQAGTTRSCARVVNPYPGTRYEGADLARIRATDVTCATARRVARSAHRRALSLPVAAGPVRRFTWNGWRVTGDLRGSRDTYVAGKGDARVRWIF